MSAALSGLTMLATLSGLEVRHAVGPPMLATLSGLTMLATLSGLEVEESHAVGPPDPSGAPPRSRSPPCCCDRSASSTPKCGGAACCDVPALNLSWLMMSIVSPRCLPDAVRRSGLLVE
jgi:hypothetical protein